MEIFKIAAMIALAVVLVTLAALIIFKVAEYIKHFNWNTRRIAREMGCAEDDAAYQEWHKQLRCHYLCLIPFVNKRNVSRVYPFFFRREKRVEKAARADGLGHILAPSVIGACLCAICLCGVSWAWFTASIGAAVHPIQTPSYTISSTVTKAGETQPISAGEDGGYKLSTGTYTVTLTAEGTASTGYCKVKVGEEEYNSAPIVRGGTLTFTIQVNGGGTANVILTPSWGSATPTFPEGNVFTVTTTAGNSTNGQSITAPDAPVAANPDANTNEEEADNANLPLSESALQTDQEKEAA